jgi:hypothetical protein
MGMLAGMQQLRQASPDFQVNKKFICLTSPFSIFDAVRILGAKMKLAGELSGQL